MQENKQDSQRADIFHQKKVNMEEAATQSAPVGELVTDNLMGNSPTNEDTRQEAYGRQEYLASDEVEPFQ